MKTEATDFPDTLSKAIRYFSNGDKSMEFMKALRWPDGVVFCPNCTSDNVGFLSTRKLWKCRKCKKQFSVKVGTIFEDSPLGLDKWLPAVWVIVNAKNGVSSCELARSLGVTQKTAWFMLHRIRLALQQGNGLKIGGVVEVDETYIGGKARSMNAKQKARKNKIGTGQWHLAPVQGLLQRSTRNNPSRIILKHVESAHKRTLDPGVREHVEKGSSKSLNTKIIRRLSGYARKLS